MSSNEQYPARVEQFHSVEVTLYEIEGKDYLTGEDIGRCLGLSDPRKSVNNILRRNREELAPYKAAINLMTPGGKQEVLVFTETGANLIGMFSRTPRAKDFRLWLAKLPRRVRALVNGEAVRQAFQHGLEQGLSLVADLPVHVLSLEDLGQLIALRRLGFTQVEAANSLGVGREAVQVAEKLLKARGLEFEPVRQGPRRRRFRALAARALCEVREIPSPSPQPSPAGGEGVKELGHGTSAG